jgi:hypothetical protein
MSSARALARTPLPRGVTLVVSGVVLSGVVLTARTVAILSPVTPHPLLTTTAATLDLTVTSSLLAWWMLARDFGWSSRALVALFLAALMLAGVVLPADREGPLRAMHLAVAPLELVLMAWLVRRVARARRKARERPLGAGHFDVQDTILLATADVVGAGRFAEILADEMSVLYYALARHPGDGATQDAPQTPNAEVTATDAGTSSAPLFPSLTYHRKTAYGAVVFALILVTLGEIPAMHFLIRLWSDRAAWIFTALGLYAILWVIGDWRACRFRPIRVEDGTLRIRFGLRWRADVPLDSIVRVRPSTAAERATRGAVDLRLALPGGSWTVLELDRPVVAVGMYGRRRTIRSLGLGVDEPARLAAVLGPAESPGG